MKKGTKGKTQYGHLHDLELLDLFIESASRGDLTKKEERAVLRELQDRGVYVEIGGEGDECPLCVQEGFRVQGKHFLH